MLLYFKGRTSITTIVAVSEGSGASLWGKLKKRNRLAKPGLLSEIFKLNNESLLSLLALGEILMFRRLFFVVLH